MDSFILKIRLLCDPICIRQNKGSLYFVKQFFYKDIKRATDGFKRIIERSSNGLSYYATFQDGDIAIVQEITVLNDHDDNAFYREVQLLARLHHRHIATLFGFSAGHKRFLVLENPGNGSLKDHLSDPLKTPLNWRTRLQIAIGVAAALEYLLFFCDPPVSHVSISSNTIMLDENFVPKLSYVSLLAGTQNGLLNSSKQGSLPQVNNIAIFQFGLMILELVTGQSSEMGQSDWVQWVQESHFLKSISKTVDSDLGSDYNTRELDGLLVVARMCIESTDKPTSYASRILRYLKVKVVIC